MATYASVFANGAYLEAPSNSAYQFSRGDFTVESWVRAATSGVAGAIISRKGSSGGPGNGGFLVVIRPDGSIKFATDNGFDFFEIDTVATNVNDGSWHHVAAVRQGPSLTLYLDGLVLSATSRGSGSPPLDVNNSLPLTIGATQQQQEPYGRFTGSMDAVTIWNMARSAVQVASDLRTVLSGNEAGLVGYWTFDNQNGNDSSPLHNNASPVGTVTYTSPGVSMTGGDIALRIANGGSLAAASNAAYQFGAGDFSVEAWLRTSASGGSGTIVSRKDTSGGSGDGGFLVVVRADGTLKFATDNGTGFFEIDTVATSANDGLWHHLAAVRQGATLHLYLDAVEASAQTRGNASPPLNVNTNQPLPLAIGTTYQQQEPYKQFIGDLGAVTLWNTERSSVQVASDMRSLLSGTEAGLVGYWTFAYSNGLDLSPVGNSAKPFDPISYVTPGAPWQYYAAVFANQSYLQAAANNAYRFGTQDFTLEAWVLCSSGQGGTVIARKGSSGGQPETGGFLLVVELDGSVKFATDNGFAFFEAVTQPIGINNGEWHFLAAVRQGAALMIYLDGGAMAVQTRGPGIPPLDVNNGLPLTIGSTQQTQEPDRFFTGQLDEVTMWNVARSAQAIASDMNTRRQGNESGLVGYWSFDFRDGRDSSPIHNAVASVGSVTFLPPGAPIGAVAAPTITAVDYAAGVVSCTWTAVGQPGVVQYLLALLDGQGNQIGSASGTETHATIANNLAPGFYTVRVQATIGADTGPWSSAVPVMASAPPNLSISVVNGAIVGQWGAVDGAANYRMALYLAGQSVSSIDGPSTTATLPLPTDLTQAYTLQVRGLAGTGSISTGPWSSVIPLLEAPTLTTVLYDGTQINAQWQWQVAIPAGVTGYVCAVFEGSQEVARAVTTVLQATIPVSLQAGHSYVVQVQATGTQATGPWSVAVPVVVLVPTNLLAGVGADGNQIVATWQTISGVTGYHAELSTNGVWGPAVAVAAPPAILLDQLSAGVVYQVRVSGVNGSNSSGPWSAAVPGPFLRNGTVQYDGFGRITRIDFATSSVAYTYDALGNITTVTATTSQANG